LSEREKNAANPPVRTVPLLASWVAFLSAFVCFVVAGQLLTSRAGELYESLNVELPWVTNLMVEHPLALTATSIAWGLGLLAASRARMQSRRISPEGRLLLNAAAISSALVGVGLIYSSVLPMTRMHCCLTQ
jgi:hypothetical protein